MSFVNLLQATVTPQLPELYHLCAFIHYHSFRHASSSRKKSGLPHPTFCKANVPTGPSHATYTQNTRNEPPIAYNYQCLI